MSQSPFGSLLTAMVTPFDAKLELDQEKLVNLADYLLSNGTDGLVAVGTTGESPTLSNQEKLTVFKTLKQYLGNRAPVIAGTGSNSTRSTIELSKAAEEIGVDGLLIVNPYYNKPSQEGLYQHFKSTAEAVNIPIVLYNHPGRTGVCLSAETIQRLSQIPNIIGIKDSSGNFDLLSDIQRLTPDDFYLYSGDDPLTLPILALGGQGLVSVCSHVAGLCMSELISSFKTGNLKQAQQNHYAVVDLIRALFCAPSPAPVKAAMAMENFHVGGVRAPLIDVNESEKKYIQKALNQFKENYNVR